MVQSNLVENGKPPPLRTFYRVMAYADIPTRKSKEGWLECNSGEEKWMEMNRISIVIALLLLFHDYCDCLEKQYIWEPFNYHTIRGIVLLHQKLPCKSFWVGDKQSEWWGRIGGEVDIRAMECIEKDCFIRASVFVWLMGKQRNGNIIVWVL